MASIETIAVIGAGTMGSGIAHVFARSGFNVLLCDVQQAFLDKAVERIRTNLGREAAKGKLPADQVEPAVARIQTTTDLAALASAQFAVEAASERFEIKAELFQSLDKILPSRGYPRNQHQLNFNHQAGSADTAPAAGDRDALLQSGAGYGAGGDHPGLADVAGDL